MDNINSINSKDNRPEAKTEQNALLELQMNAAKKARIPDILTIITGLFIVFALSIIMFVTPDKTFSEQENRPLQQFPALTSKTEGKFLDRLVSGDFSVEMVAYLSDQFPFRDTFVGLKGMSEIGMLKGENNGVILGKSDYLITKDPVTKDFNDTREQLMKNIDEIALFAAAMNEMKVPVTLAAAGRSTDVLDTYMPANYQNSYSGSLWSSFVGLADNAANVKRLDLLSPLKQLIERQDRGQLYYRTDHHWTTLGAYYAYVEIIKSFKEDHLEAVKLSEFTREKVSTEFYGTTWSKAGMKWVRPDTIEFFRYDGDEDFITAIADTGKQFNGFYDRSYLEKKDKYSSFISGNNSRVDVTKPNEPGRPRMLVIKDSFAHAAVPFLAYHFDLVILDLRYYMGSVAKLVFEENIDRVLFLHNIGNLSEDDTYGILQYGVENVLEEYKRSQYPIRNIYINNNPINDYVIVIPTDENDTRKYYINAAESLQNIILERAGLELEIVKTDDWQNLDKIITFTPEGLPAGGFMRIATEGNNLIFRCNIDDREGPAIYAVSRFIDKYLKKSTGSFNFGDNFIYSDVGDNIIMIRPGQ